MPFPINERNVLEVTVEGLIRGQAIINKFHFRANTIPPLAAAGFSDIFLRNFRTSFRTNIMGFHYEFYTVARYVLREITGVNPGPAPARTNYGASYDVLIGELTDKGLLPVGTNHPLPVHETLRCKKQPSMFKRRYFKACYNRFAGFTELEQGEAPEQWTVGFAAIVTPFLESFREADYMAVEPAAGNGWQLALWSPNYAQTIIPAPPAVLNAQDAALPCFQYLMSKFVGTQISRRFDPGGTFKGK